MGVGVWYEMRVRHPVDYLFKNVDPRGSLRANVANATVRNLSNLPLHEMLESRHSMSRTVRAEVSPKAEEWGYQLGSVYVRKVHFRDILMIRQIEQKVVNRLRQVTSAIRQAGTNQVDIITSSAERQAATEFAKARSVRPQMIGQALREIGQDADVLDAVFATLEVERLIKANAEITLIPEANPRTPWSVFWLLALIQDRVNPRPPRLPLAPGSNGFMEPVGETVSAHQSLTLEGLFSRNGYRAMMALKRLQPEEYFANRGPAEILKQRVTLLDTRPQDFVCEPPTEADCAAVIHFAGSFEK